MTDTSDSILHKKLELCRPKKETGPQLDVGQYLKKAVSLAGLAQLDTQIEAKTDGADPSRPEIFVEKLFEPGLHLMIEGSKAPHLGLLSVDCEFISSMTDVLTGEMAGKRPSDVSQRPPTSIDASLVHDFLNGMLAETDAVFGEHRAGFKPVGYTIRKRSSEPSAHLFPEIPYISITLDIDIEDGRRGGKIFFAVPAEVWSRPGAASLAAPVDNNNPEWNDALTTSVHGASANFKAVLHRRKMSIGHLMKFKVGDVLEFPATELDTLTLECGPSDNPIIFMTARLGEYQENRAARISNIGPAQSAPDQQNLLPKD